MERTKFKTLPQLERRIWEVMNTTYVFRGREFNPAQNGWQFKFDRAVSRLGCCNYRKRTISLSRLLCEKNLDNWMEIHDILLHEICHAFNVKVHGRQRDNHGPKFKAIAKALGCNARASISKQSTNLNLVDYYRYTYACPACGKEYPRNTKMRKPGSCSKCDLRYNSKYQLQLLSHTS